MKLPTLGGCVIMIVVPAVGWGLIALIVWRLLL